MTGVQTCALPISADILEVDVDAVGEVPAKMSRRAELIVQVQVESEHDEQQWH